jgi:autotransporter-associated beta strand protein
VSLGAASRTITNSQTSGSLILSGVISGNAGVGLNFAGVGTTTLSGTSANTYSGGTTISGGTLLATANGAFGTGNISLTAGNVTLTLQGGTNPNFIADTATLSIGFNTDVVNLNYSGTEVVGGLIVEGSAAAPGTYGAGSFPELMGTGTITVVPEPTTVAMMALGASLLVGVQRFRRKLR